MGQSHVKSPLKNMLVAWVWGITLGVVSGGVAGAQAADPDLNNDGVVNILDISLVGSCFGQDLSTNPQCQVADTDGDGDVDSDDLNFVVGSFGQTFPTGEDQTPPVVTITDPLDGVEITSATITVNGIIDDPTASVAVNGVAGTVVNGTYSVVNVPLQEGLNTLTATATDPAGNEGTASVVVTRDTNPPNPPTVFGVTSPTRLSFQSLAGEAEPASRIDIAGAQEAVSVQTFANGLFMLNLPLEPNSINELSLTATDAAGNSSAPTEVSIVQSEDLPLPSIGEATIVSIVAGNNQEGMVGEPLPLPLEVLVTDPAGSPVAGEVVTFRVVMGGGAFAGASKVDVETDGAGKASASLTLGLEAGLVMVLANFPGNQNMSPEFMVTALAPAPLAETRLSGVVLTVEMRAIPGVTVIFEGREANEGIRLETRTDETGAFAFFDVPPGNRQGLLVHGDTATLADGPYAELVFEIDVLPGQGNRTGRQGGRGGPIFLPRIPPGVEIPLDAAGVVLEDRVVELATEAGPIVLEVPKGTHITLPAGAEPRIALLRVPVTRLPMPLPEGQFSRTVIAVAPAAAVFNPPLPISFPNLDGVPPGSQVRLISFDHAAAQFVEVGPATVSADGQRVESDPGVGIRVGAWHATPPQPRAVATTVCAQLPDVKFPNAQVEELACECWAESARPATPMGGRVVCAGNVPVEPINTVGIQGDPSSIQCICSFPIDVEITRPAEGDLFAPEDLFLVQGTVTGADAVQVTVNGTQVDATVRGTSWTAGITLPATPGEVTIMASASTGGVSDADSVMVKVVKVDLQMQGLPEEDQPQPHEENPGAFVVLNSDDDNSNNKVDKDEVPVEPSTTVTVARENDLVP